MARTCRPMDRFGSRRFVDLLEAHVLKRKLYVRREILWPRVSKPAPWLRYVHSSRALSAAPLSTAGCDSRLFGANAEDGFETQPAMSSRLSLLPMYAFATAAALAAHTVHGCVIAEDTEAAPSRRGSRHQAAVEEVGQFRYCVNRGKRNFDAAFRSLAQQQHAVDAEKMAFTYFDTYGGKAEPELGEAARAARLIPRSVTNSYDNKRTLAQILQECGCEEAFAPTFMTARQAVVATEDFPDFLFTGKNNKQQPTGGLP